MQKTEEDAPEVLVSSSDRITTITLNRPDKVNSVTVEGGHMITSALTAAAEDNAVEAVIIASTGRVFCAGFDLKTQPERDTIELALVRSKVWSDLFYNILAFPKPLIIAVNGPAVGLGCMLSLLADHVVAVEGTFLSMPEIQSDWPTPVGYTIAKYGLSASLAAHMTLTGSRIPFEQVQGLMPLDIVAPSELAAKAREAAAFHGSQPSVSYGLNKKWIHRDLDRELHEAFDADASFREDRLPAK